MELYSKDQYLTGITRIGVIAIVAMVILLSVAIILPHLAAGHRRESRIGCVNCIRQIELAFKTWAVDNNDRFPMTVPSSEGGSMESVMTGNPTRTFSVMSNEISAPKLVVCPQDTERKGAPSFGEFRVENVSYFVGVDVTQTNPAAFFIGDRNLSLNDIPVKPGLFSFTTNSAIGWTEEMHVHHGNIGMVDGSVQQMSIDYLRDISQFTGFATNRLAVP